MSTLSGRNITGNCPTILKSAPKQPKNYLLNPYFEGGGGISANPSQSDWAVAHWTPRGDFVSNLGQAWGPAWADYVMLGALPPSVAGNNNSATLETKLSQTNATALSPGSYLVSWYERYECYPTSCDLNISLGGVEISHRTLGTDQSNFGSATGPLTLQKSVTVPITSQMLSTGNITLAFTITGKSDDINDMKFWNIASPSLQYLGK
ncbi:hypothetical protein ANO11243_071210 [Dothideomycetidae sp. 11243]|nr:hypothetical protein ANO11243_071210 [fungal sp. No.11243]